MSIMGLMDKFKKILFDEDVIEVPVSSDELPERTPKNVKKEDRRENTGFIDHSVEEVDENPIKEIIVPKEEKEEVKKFDFSEELDHDFEESIPTRTRNYDDMDLSLFDDNDDIVKKEGIVDSYRVSNDNNSVKREIKDYRKMLSNEKDADKEKKPFQITPVISPVWGILDKNYKPEEIVDKTETLTKVNTGAVPRSYGPVSYNDQPLPIKKKVKTEKQTLKEDLIELNSTISEMVNEDIEEEKKIDLPKVEVKREVEEFEDAIEDIVEEDIAPTHSIEDLHDDEVIQTANYDDYEEITSKSKDEKSINDKEIEHNNIEDAFDSTSELDEINARDEEDEPVVDIDKIVEKPNDDEDDAGLDNTIETDLFNLIDSMYKDNEEEEE